MATTENIHEGGCACNAVRFTVRGTPVRCGLCHCLTCRKAHASAFNPFLVFAPDQVEVRGELTEWFSSPGYVRKFCPICGSPVCGGDADEIEISLGSFDEPGQFEPEYELWVIRREPWLPALDVPQFTGDRVSD